MSSLFNGSGDDYYTLSSPFSHNSAYTISFYVNIIGSIANFQHWVHVGGPFIYDANTDFVGLDTSTVNQRAGCAGGTTNSFPTSSALSTGTWYLVQMVRNSVTDLKVYVDGGLAFTLTDDVTSRTAASRFLVGSYNGAPTNGYIAALKVWDTNLNTSELAAEAGTYSAVKASPWGVWPLISDNQDTSGNARHFTDVGTIVYDALTPIIEQRVATVSCPLRW
jgi:hypothetical protein